MTRVAGESEMLALRAAAAQARARARPSPPGVITSKPSRTRRDARHLADEPCDLLLERVPERAAGDGERDRDRDRAVVLDEDVAHHVELGHRAA